jgi:hypothetical protein
VNGEWFATSPRGTTQRSTDSRAKECTRPPASVAMSGPAARTVHEVSRPYPEEAQKASLITA